MQQFGLHNELIEDLKVFLRVAVDENDRGKMRAVVQVAAVLGEQELLLEAQSAMVPPREILLEDDSDFIADVTDACDMMNITKGARGIRDAGKPVWLEEQGEAAGEWDNMGLLPDETDEDEGVPRDSLGR